MDMSSDRNISKSNINLLNNINSLYILNEIFSFLNAKRELNIIIYNKQMQEKLLIDIEDYKIITGKYKTGEKNGKGNEYLLNLNLLKFEGEYSNGKRNGKGKEYYAKSNLKFAGEYKNGKRVGKGEEYYDNGKLKFKGEYLNGKKWSGKGYNYYGNLIFKISNGKGNIKEYNDHGVLKFEGKYLNGERIGKGKEFLIMVN